MKEIFEPELLPQRIAVAVSGGSDSMALCLLAHDWCQENFISLIAMTVDHGLRPEAQSEAERVKVWLEDYGIPHKTLKWEGPYPETGLQDAARTARYSLLMQECDRCDVDAILLGHQREDQLETLLMRLSKGSGLQGLSAMKPSVKRHGKRLLRPLLDIQRQELRDYLKKKRQSWIEDPSNENPAYTRTKLGSVLTAITSLPGSDLKSVSLASRRLQRADAALDDITSHHLSSEAIISPFGFVTFPVEFHKKMPGEIAIRFLDRIFTFVKGVGDKPALQSLESLFYKITQNGDFTGKTLSGCLMKRFRGKWIICREAGRKGLPVLAITGQDTMCWDERFIVVDNGNKLLKSQSSELEIRVVGDDGWQFLKGLGHSETKIPLPSSVRKNLPAIWKKDQLLAVPLFSYESERMGIANDRFEMVFSPKCGLM